MTDYVEKAKQLSASGKMITKEEALDFINKRIEDAYRTGINNECYILILEERKRLIQNKVEF